MNITILCLNGLQNFVKPIEEHLSKEHNVTTCFDQNKIREAVKDADLVWLEWANELAVSLTNSDILDGKRVVLRCHSYEVLSGYIPKINWDKVSETIFVARHVQDTALQQAEIKNYHIIPNSLNVKEWEFSEHKAGKNLAFVGFINAKKGPMLLIHAFNELIKKDPTYMLHIAGKVQETRFAIYLNHMIKEFKLEGRVKFYGHVDNIQEWLKDKDYIVCSSPWESQGMGLCEAMAMGIKPVIHNFVGAKTIFDEGYLWNTTEEFVDMVENEDYNSKKYRNYIAENFSSDKTLKRIDKVIKNAKPITKLDDGATAIIAVKNGSATIGRAIESLLAQTTTPRVIVVDDASTDDTGDIVKRYDVELIKLKENKWVASARNEGLKKVKTKYVMFLDADDTISDDYIEETMLTLEEHPECGFAYTDISHVQGEEETFVTIPQFNMEKFVKHNYVSYSALMRTEDVHYSDYLNDCRNHMYDHEMFLRIAINKPGIKSDGGRFDYTIAEDSTSKNYERGRTDMYLQMLNNFQGIDTKANPGKKILLVCWGRDYLDSSKVSFEVYTFLKSLEEFGEVFTFYWDIEMRYFGKEGMIQRLKDWADKIDPTHIFHVCYKDHIPVEAWKEISEKHNTIGWFCDDNWRYDSYSKEYSAGFGHIVTTYEEVFEKYRKGNLAPIMSQWAANPFYFKDYELKKDIDVSFCGQAYGDRMKWLDGLNVDRYGKGQPNGMVEFKDLAKIYNRSKICINFSKGSNGGMQIKCRPFEVTASKSLLLCEYVEGIEDYFEIDKEIVCFKTKDELKEKIAYYLKHEEEREAIAKAGYERTHKDHLWKNRFLKIFEEVGRCEK